MKRYICLGVLLSLIMVGCSNQEVTKETTEKKNIVQEEESGQSKIEDVTLPTNLEELLQFPEGPFAQKVYSEEKDAVMSTIKERLPKLTEKATEEDYEAFYHHLASLYFERFPDPKNVLSDYKLAQFGNPEGTDERYQFKEDFHVEIVLDASGSMAGQIDGKTKMDIAKESIQQFVENLPSNAEVGLRVYGHKGSNDDKDKELSCSSTELVYPIQSLDTGMLNDALSKFSSTGWTPLDLALKEAHKDLSVYPSENSTNIIYLVSDGVNTCGGNPIQTAKEVADSDVQPILNVIGFDLDAEGQQQLQQVAQAANGVYSGVKNQDELTEELNKAQEMADKWEKWKKSAKDSTNVENIWKSFDISNYKSYWMWRSLKMTKNISNTLIDLREEKFITDKAYTYLINENEEYIKWINDTKEEVSKELQTINQANYAEVQRKIDELYQKARADIE